MIAPVAEVLTSPLVFGAPRLRLASAPGYGFVWSRLAPPLWAVQRRVWLRRSEHLAAAGPGGSRSPGGAGGDPRAGARPRGLGPLGDADATEIAISVAVATGSTGGRRATRRGVFPHPEVSRVPSGDG